MIESGIPDSTGRGASVGPLDGIRVIDLTRVLSGPYCTMMLGDLGARVIKVEKPGRGDDTRAWGPPFVGDESAYFLSINRNKESVTLDIRDPRGRDLLQRLIARADVVVENFRPGTMLRLGLDHATLLERHPRLVYCSISGFGQTGPRREQPGYDAVVQAEGGLMSITGDADGPPFRLGVAISDVVTGMFAAQGITAALLARERTGRGQHVDIGMLDATVALLTYQAAIQFATGQPPVRMGNRHPTIAPYETFAAADGDIVIAVGNDDLWRRFCRALSLDALAEDERFASNRMRLRNYDELRPMLAARLQTKHRSEWIRELTAAGVPCGAVRDVGEVLADPQVHERRMIETVAHTTLGPVRVLGSPLHLSVNAAAVRSAPPVLGQHTDQILRTDLGLSEAEIAALRSGGVV